MYTISFAFIVVLLIVSALVSASEVAFFSLKADDLDKCRQSNGKNDKIIIDLLSKPRLLLATILIINNTVNVAVVTLSTFLMWEMAGTRNPTEFVVGLVTFIVTFGLTFFGEIIPKVYATKNNLSFALFMSGAWKIFIKICVPISGPLLSFGKVIEKRFEKKGYQTTVEELNQALELASHNNETTDDEKDILKGIVNFGTLTVRQVMCSRLDISAANAEMNFHEIMDFINDAGFSRIPVYQESLDKIEGILYIKDLLPYLDESADFEWQKLLRNGIFVPDSKKIDSLLKDFQEKRIHMALVVDEYGGTSGLITLEDIIEEIIGEINDEFDEVGHHYHRVDDKTFIFESKTSLHDFCKSISIEGNTFDSVKGESESLGGLILELNHELPSVGEAIHFERFTFVIESVDRKKIKKVRVQIADPEENEK